MANRNGDDPASTSTSRIKIAVEKGRIRLKI